MAEIRSTLGVRFSDNLRHARLVLLVEGPIDEQVIQSMICTGSKKIRTALENGSLAISFHRGASGLQGAVSFYRGGACVIHSFLDHDQAGIEAVEKAVDEQLIKDSDVTYCHVSRLHKSELEDLYPPKLYRDQFEELYDVEFKNIPRSMAREKWSKRMEQLFMATSRPWNKRVKNGAKQLLADIAVDHPKQVLNDYRGRPLRNLIVDIERKLIIGGR